MGTSSVIEGNNEYETDALERRGFQVSFIEPV
jgi:hypothetical protein